MFVERTRVPVPFCTTEPLPEMDVEEKFVPWVMVSERLKSNEPLFVMALDVDREPVVPPLPICRVPAEMVVVPV